MTDAREPTEGSAARGRTHDDERSDIDRVLDVSVRLSVEIGRRRIAIADVLAMAPGAIVEFPKSMDEPLDIYVNDQLIARGEAVVVGERYGVRITEVVSYGERLRGSGVADEEVPT
jgi:flagellar motor switch protein FliN/FliY